MAKSRQQRRARRAQQAQAAAAGEPRAVARARPQREARAEEPQPREEPSARRAAGGRGGFARESWGELKKVDWPDRPQVLTGAIVVIIACAIVGAYLWVADLAFQRLVERVLL